MKALFSIGILFGMVALIAGCEPTPPGERSAPSSGTTASKAPAQVQNPTQTNAQPPAPPEQQPRSATQPLPGEYAILYGTFGTQEQAEAFSRELRAQRVNCFIYRTPEDKFGVFVGRYPNHEAARKQLLRLQEKGIKNLSLYHLGER